MRHSLDMLVHGRAEVVDYYRAAAARWQEIWGSKQAEKMETLARVLARDQAWFEEHCGGERIGQEVMVVSGFAGLANAETYSGFDDNRERARLLFNAFRISACSINVKAIAEEVVRFYGLFDSSRV
jgi:hypothetical protein